MQRDAIKAAHDLHVDPAGRQVDLECARHVGVDITREVEIRAVVLVQARVHGVPMGDGRQVASVDRHEPDACRDFGPIDGDPEPGAGRARLEDPDRHASGPRCRTQVPGPEHGRTELQSRIRRRGDIDDPPSVVG